MINWISVLSSHLAVMFKLLTIYEIKSIRLSIIKRESDCWLIVFSQGTLGDLDLILTCNNFIIIHFYKTWNKRFLFILYVFSLFRCRHTFCENCLLKSQRKTTTCFSGHSSQDLPKPGGICPHPSPRGNLNTNWQAMVLILKTCKTFSLNASRMAWWRHFL